MRGSRGYIAGHRPPRTDGRIGVYTTIQGLRGAQFDYCYVWADAQKRDVAGRLDNWNTDLHTQWIDKTTDRLGLGNDPGSRNIPVTLKGLRVKRFQAMFAARRLAGTYANLKLAFNVTSPGDYDFLRLYHHDTPGSPGVSGGRAAFSVADGKHNVLVSGTANTGQIPALTSSAVLWVQVTHDGTTVTVKNLLDTCGGDPAGADWSSVQACYTTTALGNAGGQIGFVSPDQGWISIDDLTIKADRDDNGSYETTEHVERFTLDSSGYAPDDLTYDAAGNLTYDGVYSYGYDAWNRLVEVTKAFRQATDDGTGGGGVTLGQIQFGSVVTTMQYDGQGRRIVQAVQNSGGGSGGDASYHYYYRDWSLTELRNGSDLVLKQFLFGLQYIDELVQVAINADPLDETEGSGGDQSLCERVYYAAHNSNFNVMGLVAGDTTSAEAVGDWLTSGGLVERYEYTPYGHRTVYFSPGENDALCMSPTDRSRAVTVTTLGLQPYGLCEIGHQGLPHDERTRSLQSRVRQLLPDVARFCQPDPLEYVDGASRYLPLRANPVRFQDVLGLLTYVVGGTIAPDPNAATLSQHQSTFNSVAPPSQGFMINWNISSTLAAHWIAHGKPMAGQFLNHFLGTSGAPMTAPLGAILAASDEARATYINELNAAMTFVEDAISFGGAPAVVPFVATTWGVARADDDADFAAAIHGYSFTLRGAGRTIGGGKYRMVFSTYYLSDVYDFNPSAIFGNIPLTGGASVLTGAKLMNLHNYGHARVFAVRGSFSKAYTWCHRQHIDPDREDLNW